MLDAPQALDFYTNTTPVERHTFKQSLNAKLIPYARQRGRENAVLDKARKLGVIR